MAILGLKEIRKLLWEGREKGLLYWLSQFSKTKLRQPTGQTFFSTFPKEFSHFLQTLGSHSKIRLENAKKNSGIMKSGLDAMPLFLLDDLLSISFIILTFGGCPDGTFWQWQLLHRGDLLHSAKKKVETKKTFSWGQCQRHKT